MYIKLRPSLVRPAAMALAILIGGAVTPAMAQEMITFRSGNGTIGSTDSNISYLVKTGPFTAADFQTARIGPKAYIVSPGLFYGEIASLPGDPSAQYIASDSGSGPQSALYAYDFIVATTNINLASLDLLYAADNLLGARDLPGRPSPDVAGLYLNGQALPNTAGIGGYDQQYSFSANDIGPLLHTGLNTFYFYQYDFGGRANSLFSARLTVSGMPAAVPEPSLLALIVGVGMSGALLLRRRKRQASE